MKRSLTVITAAIFSAAIALPAFAQMSGDDTPMNSSSTTTTTREYHEVQPAPTSNTVERTYRSERTEVSPAQPAEVEHKVTTRTTTEEVPPPVTTTTTTTHTTTNGY